MAETMMETVYWEMPKELLQRLHKTAEQRHQPVENVVSEILSGFLPSLEASQDDLFDWEVTRLSDQTAAQLRETAQTRMADSYRERLASLTEQSKERLLNEAELQELEQIMNRLEEAVRTRMAALYLLRTVHHVSEIP